MNSNRVVRALEFFAGTVVGGLALAFVIVYIHPQWLQPRAATAPETPAALSPAPVPAVHAEPVSVPPDRASALAHESDQLSRDLARLPANASATGSFALAVKLASPAVVNISTQRLVTEHIQPSAFDQIFGDLQPFYRRRVESALGSGVIIDSAGHIVTNNHVIANADVINVQLADGRVSRATEVGRDPDTDLALLSVKLKDLPVMPLGRSDELQVGDAVLAIGNPLGLSQTVTHGIVSATGRSQLGVATFENFIQTDAAINAGNSGGALVNEHGELIGINTAVLNKSGGGRISVEGIGFAIPVNLVRGVIRDILDHGRVIRGWIGILPEDVDDEQAHQAGLSRGGVVITNMYRNSPAVDASLRIGDIITAVDGRPVHSAQEALSQIAIKKPGANLRLHVLRARTEVDVAVHVSERPKLMQGT
ncbi:MAG TPA: trypsin-like peptidase domain-containing protein [Steroidobacteraceae bacterium]|jgi:serine peptidase DegS|nr:trypsin-like peptidase domain-containing protein [Steroidobacteraceae bacterium]